MNVKEKIKQIFDNVIQECDGVTAISIVEPLKLQILKILEDKVVVDKQKLKELINDFPEIIEFDLNFPITDFMAYETKFNEWKKKLEELLKEAENNE